MMAVIDAIVDEGSFLEIKKLFAREIITGFARIEGRAVGIVANQPKWLGGVLFVDSADKAARFIWLCDAFNVPLLYLADVPGFMIGTKVERQGIIRAGAKMIAAVSEATVPKLSVIVRKAYGAGLYAMCGPAFEPDACIALPTASIAVMGPQAAVNAVYYNKIQEVPEGPEREAYVAAAARRVPRRHRPPRSSPASWSSTRSSPPNACAPRSPRGSRVRGQARAARAQEAHRAAGVNAATLASLLFGSSRFPHGFGRSALVRARRPAIEREVRGDVFAHRAEAPSAGRRFGKTPGGGAAPHREDGPRSGFSALRSGALAW